MVFKKKEEVKEVTVEVPKKVEAPREILISADKEKVTIQK